MNFADIKTDRSLASAQCEFCLARCESARFDAILRYKNCTISTAGCDALFQLTQRIAAKPYLCSTLEEMRVLGIDCGTECTGYGVVEIDPCDELRCVAFGGITFARQAHMAEKLRTIFEKLSRIIAEHGPDQVAIEDVFYAVNVKSALKLGQARGVAMLAAASHGLPVTEYAPLSIKSAVVGYGKAEKEQVQLMVARLLRLQEIPQPADAADALAIAICDLHTAATLRRQAVGR